MEAASICVCVCEFPGIKNSIVIHCKSFNDINKKIKCYTIRM